MKIHQGISCQETPPFVSKSGENKGGFLGTLQKNFQKSGPLFGRFPLQIGHFGGPKSSKFSACGGLSPLGIVVLGVQKAQNFLACGAIPP